MLQDEPPFAPVIYRHRERHISNKYVESSRIMGQCVKEISAFAPVHFASQRMQSMKLSYQLPIQRRTFYTFSHLSRLVEKSQKAAVSKIFKTCESLVITSVLFHSAGTVHWCNLFSLDLHPSFFWLIDLKSKANLLKDNIWIARPFLGKGRFSEKYFRICLVSLLIVRSRLLS